MTKIYYSYLVKFIVLSILLLLINSSSLLQKNCIKQAIPQKFAILTLTYIRNESTAMFLRYLQQYAVSDCPLYDNIYIVWNNKQNPQQMNVLVNTSNWKKNVYILQTVVNSMDFKYMIPPWAPQTVFFDMDDDFDVSCQSMKIGFQRYKAFSYGQVGPITSFYGRSFTFNPKTQQFVYVDQARLNKHWSYFHMSLTGFAFISRHFLELYYSDIYQIKQMRKKVVQTNNCDDILLNFVISHFYPQLKNQYVKIKFVNLGRTGGISSGSEHLKIRGQCMAKFIQILGYNPLRYLRYLKINKKQKNQISRMSTDLNNNCIVGLKKQHYQKTFINNRAYYLYIRRVVAINNVGKQLIEVIRQNKKLTEAKQNIQEYIQTHDSMVGSKRYDLQKVKQINKVLLGNDEMVIHFGNKTINKKQSKKLKENNSILKIKQNILARQGLINQNTSQPITQLKQSQQSLQLVCTQLQRYIIPCLIILITSVGIIILIKNIFMKIKTLKQHEQANMNI